LESDKEVRITMEETTKVLLVWNEKRGYFDKFLLGEALKQNIKGETHYIAEQRFGKL
jgi:hypothetical protein